MSFAEVEENTASSTTNSEEYEDAQDQLWPLPERSMLTVAIGHDSNHSSRRESLPVKSEISDAAISRQLSPSQSENISNSSVSSSLKVRVLSLDGKVSYSKAQITKIDKIQNIYNIVFPYCVWRRLYLTPTYIIHNRRWRKVFIHKYTYLYPSKIFVYAGSVIEKK